MMRDSYSHSDINVIYIEENIPGPSDESDEYQNIIKEYNTQLTHSCECKKCLQNVCKCLEYSGNVDNYYIYKDIETGAITYVLNRAISTGERFLLECNDLCKCSENCGNRIVQKGPIDGLYVKITDKLKGLGLFTYNFLVKGTFICEYAGEMLTKSQAIDRSKLNQQEGKMNYLFCLNEFSKTEILQTFVDPSFFGNIGRYINHSCEPNCEIIPVRVNSPIPKLAVFSTVDIPPGNELTFNYGSPNVNIFTEKITNRKLCLCNAENCRVFMPFNAY